MAGTARENILKRIKQALKQPVPVPFPGTSADTHFVPMAQEPVLEFAERFTALQGKFCYCSGVYELAEQLRALAEKREWKKIYCRDNTLKELLHSNGYAPDYHGGLASCDAAITGCEYLVARTGSILLGSGNESGRTVSVYAPIHICIAYAHQVKSDIADGIEALFEPGKKYPSMVTLATGPSRTADIEKTLVVGVHGPKEVYCFLIEE
jgi:L-lactate dehydrogenase complex protein LldG